MENEDDPFASITHVSSSQEQQLLHCRFAGEESDDEDTPLFGSFTVETPVESTEILMVSPPESATSQPDVFRTPPEESTLSTPPQNQQQQFEVSVDRNDDRTVGRERDTDEIMTVDGDYKDEERVFDLGKDTDLVSGSEELTERIECGDYGNEKEGTGNEFATFEVLKRKEGSDAELCESPAKRLKLAGERGELTAEGERNSVLQPVESLKLVDKSVVASKNLDGESSYRERVAKAMTKLNSPLKMFGVLATESGLKAARGSLGREGDEISKMGTSVQKSNCQKNSYNDGPEIPEVGQIEETLPEGLCNDGLELREVCRSVEIETAVNDVDKEIHREPAKRKLRFSTEVIQSDHGESNVCNRVEETSNGEEVGKANKLCKPIERNSVGENIDDIDKFRYVRPGHLNTNEKEKDLKGKRMLPASIFEDAGQIQTKAHHNQNAASIDEDAGQADLNSHHNQKGWGFLLDALRMISRRRPSNYDSSMENMSVLEAAKKRGMKFPCFV